MRQQLRLRVLAPVAVLGLLGAGFSAFAAGGPPATDPAAVVTPRSAVTPKAKKKEKKAEPAPVSQLEQALQTHRRLVVAFYAPGGSVDSAAVREARAGALEVGAGFLALNVTRSGRISGPAKQYGVYEAPTVIVLKNRRPVFRVSRYVDRETIAQAVTASR